MKIIFCNKRSGYSVNFIDRHDVYVGYDLEQSCCENADYYFILPDGTETEHGLEESPLEEFVFDTSFTHTSGYGSGGDGGQAKFRLTKGNQEAFLIIFNDHNGYYSHGFIFSHGDTTETEIDDFFYLDTKTICNGSI